MNDERNIKHRMLLILLFLFAFLTNFWVLKSSNSLTMDNFTTICNAKFNGYSEIFRLFPSKSYNDRPIGVMFVKILNDMFDSNYKMYNYVFLGMHFINITLVYFIGLRIFNKDKNSYMYAILMAAIFGIYPVSLMTVQWISAVYDLMCCFFILLTVLFYLKAREKSQYNNFYGILTILFYYLSLRSKEMALTIPVILIIYELAKSLIDKKRIRISWFLYSKVIFMFAYAYILFTSGMKGFSTDNPYYQNFNPVILIRDLIRYLILYCDLGNSSFTYNGLSKYSLPLFILCGFIVVFSIFIMIKLKDFSLFLSIICVAGSFTVVLPMVNMQHRLYLYIPSIFISISCAVFLKSLIEHWNIKNQLEIVAVIIPLLYLLSFTPGIIQFKLYWEGFCKQDAYTLERIQKIETPTKGSTIYIKGASSGYNTFYYGPGDSIKLLFNDNTLNTVLVNEFPEDPHKPYSFWQYDNGNVTEVTRDISKTKKEISVYPTEIVKGETKLNNDGTIFISVTTDNINNNYSIVVNNKKLPTTVGKEFISTVVPAEMLNSNQLEVYIIDNETEKISEKKTISIK